MVIFGINFPQKGISLKRFFFTKFRLGEVVPGLHLRAKFHCCSFKNVATGPQIVENGIFGKNLPLGENSGGR